MDLHEHIEALGSDAASEHVTELDDETLSSLQSELEGLFKSIRAGDIEGTEPDDLDVLNEVATAIRAVRAEADSRREAAETRASDAAALEAELLGGPNDPEPDDDDGEPEGVAPIVVEVPEPEPEPEPERELVSVGATTTSKVSMGTKPKANLARLAAARKPAEADPRPVRTMPRWKLNNGTTADFFDLRAIAERVIEAQNDWLGSRNGVSDKLVVANFKVPMPDELMLTRTGNAYQNAAKLDAIVAPGQDPKTYQNPEVQAIVASGGWCAPLEPQYTIPSITSAGRPFRDSLPRVGAERGGIQFVRAARLSTVAGAVSLWENSTDQVPGGTTKTRLTHACRTVQEEPLGAVVYRERFGNFQQRAFPEDVAHDIELGMANHARRAEVRLMDALIADVNIDVSMTGLVATARDAKHHISQAVQEIRYTERMGRNAPVRVVVSDVLLPMMVADVAFQQASGEIDALLMTDAQAEQVLRSIGGVNYTFTLDVPTGADAFATNADNENLADWPDNFWIPIFPEGTVAFADGGELNLGIVRDSTLNNTNDYEIFIETFEGLLWLGPYAKTLRLITCPGGDSQVALDNTGALCSGS